MTHLRFLAGAGLLALGLPAAAQYAPPPMSDADRLSAEMRLIGINPRDVAALTEAGELSLKLGDLSGAASLFARADKVDPRNGRVKAGMADVLLRNERPGEALIYFDQAEGYGWPMARFAADRGLAYDLTGQQGRAQRDYRTALAAAPDAETSRRYALSLAISGQKEAALAQLDPLTRTNDRGAWRARAFVLAMTGDSAGATAIATRMMAPGQAQGLAPFFGRLSTLGPVDRAFAVHFGEVRATPQRLADARMAPALPPMAPEVIAPPAAARPAAPVQVAAATAPRKRRGREAQVAAAAPPVQVPAPASSQAPAFGASAALAGVRPASQPVQLASVRSAAPVPASRARNVTVPVPAQPAGVAPRPAPAPGFSAGTVAPATSRPGAVPVTADVSAFTEQFRAARIRDAAAASANRQALVSTPSAPVSPVQLAAATPAASRPAPMPGAASVPFSAPLTPAPASSVAVAQATPAVPPTPAGDDAVLSRLFAQMALPGDEMARAGELATHPERAQAPAVQPVAVPPSTVDRAPAPARHAGAPATALAATAPVPRRAAVSDDAPVAATRGVGRTSHRGDELARADTDALASGRHPAKATADRPSPDPDATPLTPAQKRAAARRGGADQQSAEADTDAPLTPAQKRAAARKAATEQQTAQADADAPLTPAQKRAADRKAAADKKAAEAKRLAAEQAKEDAREAAEAKKAARAEPQRYWVQVAGGANEATLPKAWAQAQDKASVLKGRAGWTTPLRATNRVLAGPFKTDEEARAFTNKVRAQGIQAWQFTSVAGQKVVKLSE